MLEHVFLACIDAWSNADFSCFLYFSFHPVRSFHLKVNANDNLGLMYSEQQNTLDPVDGAAHWMVFKGTGFVQSRAQFNWYEPLLAPSPPSTPKFEELSGFNGGGGGGSGDGGGGIGSSDDEASAVQAAIAASLQPEIQIDPPDGFWLTKHAPTTQYKCFILKNPGSSADKIFGTTACCIIATITALRNCVEPDLPLRVVTANTHLSPAFEDNGGGGGSASTDISLAAAAAVAVAADAAGADVAPEGGRLLWAELLQTGTEAYVAKLKQEGKVDAQTKPLFYVPEILDLAFASAGITDPTTIAALKGTVKEFNVQLNHLNVEFSVGDHTFIGRDGLHACFAKALRVPCNSGGTVDGAAGSGNGSGEPSGAPGTSDTPDAAGAGDGDGAGAGDGAGGSAIDAIEHVNGGGTSQAPSTSGTDGGGGSCDGGGVAATGGAAEDTAEGIAADAVAVPCIRSIIITHYNKTFALLQQRDGRIFFRDSHDDRQWDFTDEVHFITWLQSRWCCSHYFQFDSWIPTSSQIDVFVLASPLEGHPNGSRGGAAGGGGSAAAIQTGRRPGENDSTNLDKSSAAAAAVAAEPDNAQEVRDSVLEYSEALNTRLNDLFTKLDVTKTMVLSKEDFDGFQNSSYLWGKLLNVANWNQEDDRYLIERWNLHSALIKRALAELGADMYKLPQPSGEDETVDSYLTKSIVLKHHDEALMLCTRLQFWIQCMEDELVQTKVRPTGTPSRNLSNQVSQAISDKRKRARDADRKEAESEGKQACTVM